MGVAYTRTGKVENNNDDYRQYRKDYKQYRFPIRADIDKEIRVNVPLDAVKADITEAIEHLQVIANNMEG